MIEELGSLNSKAEWRGSVKPRLIVEKPKWKRDIEDDQEALLTEKEKDQVTILRQRIEKISKEQKTLDEDKVQNKIRPIYHSRTSESIYLIIVIHNNCHSTPISISFKVKP